MKNKYNVLDPVLVYATIDGIYDKDGKLVYSIKIETCNDNKAVYIDFVSEESIQTVF